jgi:putative addiction module component (TIGR02574 family)
MSREADMILEDALQLPPEARAAVAGRLIESLDVEIDENAEAAWSAEISRRLVELDSGGIKTVPWEEARRLILGSTDAAARR